MIVNHKNKIKKIFARGNIIINIFLILICVILFFIADKVGENCKISGILENIGTSFIVSVILFVLYLLLSPTDQDDNLERLIELQIQDAEDLVKARALYKAEGIFDVKSMQEYHNILNSCLADNKNSGEYSLICFGGLTGLRMNQGSFIEEQLKKKRKKPVRIRILTVNPYSPYLVQFVLDEQQYTKHEDHSKFPYEKVYMNSQKLSDEIFELYKWVQSIKKTGGVRGSIEIKFYDSLPALQYHRVDNFLVISSNMIGESQKQKAIAYVKNSKGFMYYTEYFERLWADKTFSKPEPKINLNPYLLIGDKRLGELLKESCKSINAILDKMKPLIIRAILIICDYPENGKRIGTNQADIHKIDYINNDTLRERNKEDVTLIVGRAIKEKQVLFEKLDDEISQGKDKYAVLALPIFDSEKNVIAALTYDFYIDSKAQIKDNNDGSKDLLTSNMDIVDEAKKYLNYISIYLHIDN